MTLMNNILKSKKPVASEQTYPKKIILSTIWHTKTHQGKSLVKSVSLSILLIKSFL